MSCKSWENKKIGEITNNLDARRIPLSTMQRTSRKGKYPYYGAQGIIDYIDGYIFEGEYLLVAEDGANLQTRTQDICLLTKVDEKFWVNNHAHIIESNGLSDIRFIKYYLNHYDISGYITGSAQPKLNQSNFKKIEICLPTIIEQKAITNILSSLDDKIELNNKINENLEETAQTLYKQWFVDFDFPNEFGEPYQSSGGEMIDSELGLIPKGWHITDLSELIKKEKEKSMGDLNLRLIDMANMPSYSISLNQFADGDKLTTNIFKMKKMSFLYGSIRPYLGKFGIAPFDGITTGTIHNFTVKKTDDYSYIAGIIFSKKFNDFCIRLSHGTKMPVINWDNFASYKIVYNKNLAINFNKLLLSSIKKIIQNVNENINLAETRDLLLPKLMSGEIEVEIEE